MSTSHEMSSDSSNLHPRRSEFHQILNDFNANSTETFRIVYTFPNNKPVSPSSSLRTLYVLDSSFNPPTRAHLTIARNAVLRDAGKRPARLMLLLATENADKKARPAAFEDRLVMMSIAAEQLHDDLIGKSQETKLDDHLQHESHATEDISVDVAITKKPFYIDKAMSIDESGVYPEGTQQVHITGYDTIIRIFNPKYYPEDKKLRVLEPYFSKHRLRVCYRLGVAKKENAEGGDDRKEQEAYVESIGDGSREDEGMNKEWRQMIELVDDASTVEGVSSTKARESVSEGKLDDLESIVGKASMDYIVSEKLYQESESVKK